MSQSVVVMEVTHGPDGLGFCVKGASMDYVKRDELKAFFRDMIDKLDKYDWPFQNPMGPRPASIGPDGIFR